MYFFTGWTVLIYMSLPVIRIVWGLQPIAGATASQFLLHFAPYFVVSLMAVAVAGAGSYTFAGFTLAAASFWVHVHALVSAIARRPARFVVTPKKGTDGPQPRAVAPALAAVLVLVGVAAYGLERSRDPGTLNNVAFAALHTFVLLSGASAGLLGARHGAGPAVEREPAELAVETAGS
jgi:cellulose synthase (UDP-forming)